MTQRPPDIHAYRRTDTFSEETVPAAPAAKPLHQGRGVGG
jgi:hypothetical protein